MARLATFLFLFFIAWFIFGAPFAVLEPMGPSAAVPTFEQGREDGAALRQADAAGLLRQDPVREERRQAVIQAFERLKESPCDEGLRREYAASLRPFIKSDLRGADKPPLETYEVDGRVLNATSYFDSKAQETMYEALTFGYLRPEDLPGAAGLVFRLVRNSPQAESALARISKVTGCGERGRT